jgi:hypothetical protein
MWYTLFLLCTPALILNILLSASLKLLIQILSVAGYGKLVIFNLTKKSKLGDKTVALLNLNQFENSTPRHL